MKKLFTYPERCTGCRQCSLACSLTRYGECNPKKAAITIVRDEFDRYEFPLVCLQCDDPICVRMCPQNALVKENGVVKRDEDKCIGCKLCVVMCPYSAITVLGNELIQCDLCGGDPECVKFCVTDAIQYVEETEELSKRRKELVVKLLKEGPYLAKSG